MRHKLFFRADGNSQMRMGHVIRSLALAEMLLEDFDCLFIIRDPLLTLSIQIKETCEMVVIPSHISKENEAVYLVENCFSEEDIVVLDGYHFGTVYQQVIKNNGNLLVCIDDIHDYHFVADMVINHAGGISVDDYSTEIYTQMLLGPKYALLRPDFRHSSTEIQKDGASCFICMGGADPNNATSIIVKDCLDSDRFSQINVVIGGGYLFKDQLFEEVENYNFPINIHSQLRADEMVRLMQKCNYAVSSPSTVAYEYLSQGGVLFLYLIADNQKDLLSYLTKSCLAFEYDGEFNVDDESITEVLQNQSKIFDRDQASRLRNAFRFLSAEIRLAELQDLDLVYEWANDPVVRNNSYQSSEIPYESHVEWFTNKIGSPSCVYYILQMGDVAIGQIRFDLEGHTATINYSVDSNYREKGVSKILLRKGIAAFLNQNEETEIVGYVKKGNIASMKSFQSIGTFIEEEVLESDSYRFIYKR